MRTDKNTKNSSGIGKSHSSTTVVADASFESPIERISGVDSFKSNSLKKATRMRSENFNYINKMENCESRLKTPTSTTAPASGSEERRKNTSICVGSNSRLSSSTPRRKRNMLTNLYSDLSPNYIGFRTPQASAVASNASMSDDGLRTRSARYRKLLMYSASPERGASNSGLLTDASKALLGCVRRTRSPVLTPSPTKLSARKQFESPIEKLLVRNGSIGLNDISKENIVKNLALSPKPNLNIGNSECEIDQEAISQTEIFGNTSPNGLLKINEKQNNVAGGIEDRDEEEETQSSEKIKSEDMNDAYEDLDTNVTLPKESDVNSYLAVKIENESFGNITEGNSENTETLLGSGDAVEPYNLEGVESGESMILSNAVGLSAKSPSAVSLDSAKGSSIVTGMTWMSFTTGDLFWGQIYTYCYWPCIVSPDPDGKTITTERNARNGEENVLVHVRFFADSGRRNWVKRENLIPYTDLENYKQQMREIRKKYGKNSLKYKLLLPKPNKVMIWREAIKEANKVAEVIYEDRLTKFFEIYEHKKSLQKLQRQQRKLSIDNASSTGSLRRDSMESLLVKNPLSSGKRDRSASPYSPAFSPLKTLSNIKRRKLSETNSEQPEATENLNFDKNNEVPESTYNTSVAQTADKKTSTSSSFAALHEMELNNHDFRRFYSAMKEFVLEGNTDDCLERSLIVAARNIWALKQINRHQIKRRLLAAGSEHELGSALLENDSGTGTVKRLSNRLRTLNHRHSLPAEIREPMSVETLENQQDIDREAHPSINKPRKPLNRPIEEVIDDIFNLDNKYLFRGLARDPVCKYCLHPGGPLVRCAKGCQSWLHADCIGKDPNIEKKKNVGRRKTKSDNARRSSSKTPVEAKMTYEPPNTPSNLEDEIARPSSAVTYHVTADAEIDIQIDKLTAEVICDTCAQGKPPVCAVCREENSPDPNKEELVLCNMQQCTKAFHPACCRYWPQAKFTKSKNKIESFRCPSHVCHTCVSDDPKGKFQHLSNAKLTKCVKCPASYHMDSTCIPAGSQILTAAHIICPRHNTSNKSDGHVNVSWCFICVGGGQVICCETCPTAVHAKCLNIPLDPSEGYICEECESGRLPLYGEMVWAKFNSFRWWPAIILPPTEIPQNIRRKAHNSNDFVVRFFGTHDHGWISRRRVYLYLEGDSSEPPKTKSSLDQSYNRGVQEAKRIYEIIKSKKLAQCLTNESKEKLHPQPYVRIKANRAVHPVKLHIDLEKVNKCECRNYDEDPCGPSSNCLNRVLYHECNPKLCPAGDRCQNQMFESRLSPRLDVVYLKERGFGLICREPINAGDFIIEYVGEIIDDNEFRQRMAQKSLDRDENFYFLSVEKDYIIDAGPKGNLARFMNHSCDPNCETQKWSVNGLNRIGLFAIKDIPADTELTFNYHWDDLLGNQKKLCLCGAAKCVGEIGGKSKDEKVSKETVLPDAGKAKTGAVRKRKAVKRLQNRTREGKVNRVNKKGSNITSENSEASVQVSTSESLTDEQKTEIDDSSLMLGNNRNLSDANNATD